jgi:cell division protease FtsH
VRTGNRIDEQVRGLASEALERAMAVLTPRRALIDDLVNRLIEMETIDGDSFRTLVEAHEAAGGSALAAQAGSKADVEAAQVGV